MNRICLIGFGNLGYRYFQAILNIKLKFELSVVDIVAPFDKGYAHLSNFKKKNFTVKFYKKINQTSKNEVMESTEKMLEIIERNKFPKATTYKKRCLNCTYRNICIK